VLLGVKEIPHNKEDSNPFDGVVNKDKPPVFEEQFLADSPYLF